MGKRKNDLTGTKYVHESWAGQSWRNLEMQIEGEVESAICTPSVLVSVEEGQNTRFVYHI